jgi:hypothetical protein
MVDGMKDEGERTACPLLAASAISGIVLFTALLKDSLRRQRSTYMMGRDLCMYSQVLCFSHP